MLKMLLPAVAILILSGSAIANAQGYRELPVDPKLDPDNPQTRIDHNTTRMRVQELARGQSLDDNGRQLIRNFLRKAYFPAWTRPANLPQIGAKRSEFLRTFYPVGGGGAETRELINEETKNVMAVFIAPEYHPVLRYNAMLLLGELRTTDANVGTGQPEVPYAPSNAIILSALEDADQSDAVKVAAWVGLQRRCELYGPSLNGMDNNEKRKVLSLTVQMLEADEAPEGRNDDVHLWMRRRAMDVVAALRTAGPQGVFAKALDKIIENDDLPTLARCEAMVVKGNLNFDQATREALDIPGLSVRMARISQKAIEEDLEWFDKALALYEKNKLGGAGQYGLGGMGMEYSAPAPSPSHGMEYGSEMGGRPAEPERDPLILRIENTFRRRVKFHTDAAKIGLVGSALRLPDQPQQINEGLIRYAKSEDDRKAMYTLAKSMISMLAQMDDAKTQEKELLTAARSKFNSMRDDTLALAGANAEALLEEDEEALEESGNEVPRAGIPELGVPGSAPTPRSGPQAAPAPTQPPGEAAPPSQPPGTEIPGANLPPMSPPGTGIPSDGPPQGDPAAEQPAN